MRFSVIIPTFNRRATVKAAIDSALTLAAAEQTEIVISDDGSSDGTVQFLEEQYRQAIDSGTLRILRSDVNHGVSWAKNNGANAARGRWLVFLDSDDRLATESVPEMPAYCDRAEAVAAPVIFFRCRSHAGRLIGEKPLETARITTEDYLCRWSWGECLPVVDSLIFKKFPYDADLRGFEGLAYARMMKSVGAGLVAGAVMREYDDTGADRLSTRAGIGKRVCLLARGHLRVLKEFWRELGVRHALLTFGKVLAYTVRCLVGGRV